MANKSQRAKVFGEIKSLTETVPWTTGLSSMFEWITWDTKQILGVSKAEYIRKVISLSKEYSNSKFDEKKMYQLISNNFKSEAENNVRYERFDEKPRGLVTAYEALRRSRFFHEEYLNQEFDTFLYLVSSHYLDQLYSNFFTFKQSNEWKCFGNSGLFKNSTEAGYMQIDNLAYNHDSKILVANELKLGGTKNKDQILKYLSLFIDLADRGFIGKNVSFRLLFLSENLSRFNQTELLTSELEYCIKKHAEASDNHWYQRNKEVIKSLSTSLVIQETTWNNLIKFNKKYLLQHHIGDETTIKLLNGFNSSLEEKFAIQHALTST